jgi:ABC-2 type transport system permease protein
VIELLQAMESGPKSIKSVKLNDQKKAFELVKSGIYKGALIIPAHFSEDVVRNLKPQLGLFLDNTDSISANFLASFLSQSLIYLKLEYVPVRVDPARPELRVEELFKKMDYDASLVPGAVAMAIFMGTMISGAFNLVMDRFLGIHESYLSTPLTKRDIVIGTVTSGVLITTVMSFMVLIAGMLLTGIKLEGGLIAVVVLFLTIVLLTLGLLSMMFIILGRADHPRIVGLISGFLNVIFFFPSGAVYPVESFPDWLRAFAKVNPEAYAVHALKALIFKGANIMAIKQDLIFLAVFTAIMLTVATATFKRTL